MRYYTLKLNFPDTDERARVVQNLLDLKEALDKQVPAKEFNENLLISTWNIRDFDSNKFGHGPRLTESLFYLAEIISHYDLVALQEVSQDLGPLGQLMYILGEDWDFIATDVTEGKSGNRERMAFLYDQKRVTFRKIAGEIVLPGEDLLAGEQQFARTPFTVAFQSGWFRFSLCTVHIYYGADSGDGLDRRIREIEQIAKFLAERNEKYNENMILLGDFNIVSPEHQTMKALKENGFQVPAKIQEKPTPTNMFQTKYYDQIAYKEKKGEMRFAEHDNSAGVFNYYDIVFRSNQFPDYRKDLIETLTRRQRPYREKLERARSEKSKAEHQEAIDKLDALKMDQEALQIYYLEDWRTFQMSDHLPMWIELRINFSEDYLKKIQKPL
ncbi:MAG: endonuclease/exonuclease/phosphatase family protein [Saprospiraceae bacterium]|nr:endonuclease/exonuclease/phosphatase family protein [Saprospiraceae bacterium]